MFGHNENYKGKDRGGDGIGKGGPSAGAEGEQSV
jgi:hypothetical protein